MDLEQFWKTQSMEEIGGAIYLTDVRVDLGLFFWGRGGKRFWEYVCNNAEDYFPSLGLSEFPSIKQLIRTAKKLRDDNDCQAQDFLDALACLGEDKIKELIKELK